MADKQSLLNDFMEMLRTSGAYLDEAVAPDLGASSGSQRAYSALNFLDEIFADITGKPLVWDRSSPDATSSPGQVKPLETSQDGDVVDSLMQLMDVSQASPENVYAARGDKVMSGKGSVNGNFSRTNKPKNDWPGETSEFETQMKAMVLKKLIRENDPNYPLSPSGIVDRLGTSKDPEGFWRALQQMLEGKKES